MQTEGKEEEEEKNEAVVVMTVVDGCGGGGNSKSTGGKLFHGKNDVFFGGPATCLLHCRHSINTN